MSDQLRRVRNLGFSSRNLPADHIFGVSGASDRWDAHVHRGAYSAAEQATDPDLGRSTTLGWRNVTTETRALAAPRSGMMLSRRPQDQSLTTRTMAMTSRPSLLYPPQFASLSIEDAEFVKPRTRPSCSSFSRNPVLTMLISKLRGQMPRWMAKCPRRGVPASVECPRTLPERQNKCMQLHSVTTYLKKQACKGAYESRSSREGG